jgi:hypothetical protein
MRTTSKKSAWIDPRGKLYSGFESHESFAFELLIKSGKITPAKHQEIIKTYNELSTYLVVALGWCRVQDMWYTSKELFVYPEKINILQERTFKEYKDSLSKRIYI